MPRKVVFNEYGPPSVLQVVEEDLTAPAPGQIQVENKAIGLNLIETYFRRGVYQVKSFPSTLGSEAAGIVHAVGEGVTEFKKGDRVAYYALGGPNSYADYSTIGENQAVHLPDSVEFEVAAAILVKGLTVNFLLQRLLIKPAKDEVILYHAAAGGVGLLFLQWAKHLGIKVIGTVGSDEKAKTAKEFGAWETINYRTEDFAKRVEELTDGRKVRIVYDSVGRDTWEGSLHSLQKRGLMVSFGNASGKVPPFDINVLNQLGSLSVTRPSVGGFFDTPQALREGAAEVFELVAKGAIKVSIQQRFALSKVSQAHEAIEARTTSGSSVIIPDKV